MGRCVAVLDSGIGGLSVVSEYKKISPYEDILYFADTSNYPYGTQSQQTVQQYFSDALNWLQGQKIKAVLCACSTASCVAVPHFEGKVPFPLVGMLNADLQKVVYQQKDQGTIGIIATPLTVQSRAFDLLLRQESVSIHAQPAPELVDAVTRGDLRYETIRPVLEAVFSPVNVAALGCLVIGCTHFYHVRELIREFLGSIPLIEPSRVAAKVLKERLTHLGWVCKEREPGQTLCVVSGDLMRFKARVEALEGCRGERYIDQYISLRDLLNQEALAFAS